MRDTKPKNLLKTFSTLLILTSVLIAGIAATGSVTAQNSPGQPVEFYGTIVDENGDPAPTGVEVYASINGSVEDRIEVTEAGEYGSFENLSNRLTVNDGAGNEVRFTVTDPDGPESVDSPYDLNDLSTVNEVNLTFSPGAFEQEAEDDDGTTGDDGGGGGGGGGGGSGGGSADTADDGSEDIQNVIDRLQLTDPSTDTTTEIVDADPDSPGITVRPDGTEVVTEITFDDEEATGSVSIQEYNNLPQSSRDITAESITTSGAVSDPGSISVSSVHDITPDTDVASNSGSTVTFSIPADDVTNPEQLRIVKESFDFDQQEDTWQQLDTTIENVGEDRVTVSARASEFSLFAVAEVEQSAQPDDTAADDGAVDDGQEPDDDGSPIAPLVIGILLIIAIAGAYLYTQNSSES